MSGGRPSVYTDELADRICEWIADGKSLRSFERENDDSPALSTICLWIVNNEKFSEHYRRARQAGGYAHADDILEVADQVLVGQLEPASAKVVIDAKKWAAERMAPKGHATKQVLEHVGEDGGPIKTESTPDVELARQVAFLLAKGVQGSE